MAIIRPASGPGSGRTDNANLSVAPGGGALSVPAPYAPVAHPGTPGRWSDEAILRALRDWAVETGAPPRRQDWSGEDPRAAPPAQRKWMREHPYWPSSSCVAAHFGSWSRALEAAGLPARKLTFEDTVGERIQTAWRMRAQGHTIRAIGEQLGVSTSTVHNYLKAGSCPQCGGPVASPRAHRCLACTASEPTLPRAWTRDGVREAIRAWTAEHGRAPSYHEWTPSRTSPGVWETESPRWPSAAVVCDSYADYLSPWNAALLDAGASIRFQRWSDDATRAALAEFWTRTGRAPVPADLQTASWRGPTSRTLRRRYGGIAQAWAKLGPVPEGIKE
ncbi:MAG TPA: helix-turn-helix domain-containing protein [Solirubrobacteraceae bacterium]